MSRLTSQRDTEEIQAVTFTDDEIARELKRWTKDLATAKAAGDIFAADTALTWIDRWLERKLQAER